MIRDGTMYKQLDIVFTPFPYSDLSGTKKRPALIISNEKINNSSDVICCLITSNPSNKGISLENNSFEGPELPFKSWVKPNRIFTIEKSIIIKKISRIRRESYNKIFEEIFENLAHLK